MNLINDPWIPVVRASGKRVWIKPAQVVSEPDDPVVRLDAPRPDFNGALIQFLIGLLQTCFAPEDDDEWEERFDNIPTEERLDKAFQQYAFAFNLDGDGPRFMQDFDLKKNDANEIKISQLFIEAPGEKTLKDNTDHFIRRGFVEKISFEAGAMLLLTLQLNAPSGGAGHRTGLRGGGPFTTILLAKHTEQQPSFLWRTLWLNVFEKNISLTGNEGCTTPKDIFPWIQPTKTSENNQTTTPEDVNPLHMYWAMPRRIRLVDNQQLGTCDLLNLKNKKLISEYHTKNYGANYAGMWRHPLSPYYTDKKGQILPLHPKSDGVNYQHWMGLIGGNRDDNTSPAENVFRFRQNRYRRLRSDFHIWAFGYEMDKMKAVCWREGIMPVVWIQNSQSHESFRTYTSALIEASKYVRNMVISKVKESWVNRPKELKGDFSFISDRFWQSTEPSFYQHLNELKTILDSDPKASIEEVMKSWQKELKTAAETIFEDFSQDGAYDAVNPERVARAWNNLQNILRGPKLKEILGLPVAKKEQKGNAKNGKEADGITIS